MPYGFGTSAVFTTSAGGDIGGGRHYTRLRGPVLLGSPREATGWPSLTVQPPHVANVSTQMADTLITPAGTAVTLTTSAPAGLVYLSQSTATLIGAGSTANAPAPAVTGGTAVAFDQGGKALLAYSSAYSGWLIPNAGTGATQTTSAPTFVTYIPITSGAGNLMAAGSTANAPTVLATGFAALCWDAAKLTLSVYDPFTSAWCWPHMPNASAGSAIVWSATSS